MERLLHRRRDARGEEGGQVSDADKDKIIALLQAEVKAWRDADESRDEEQLPWDKAQAIIKAVIATDSAGALENK